MANTFCEAVAQMEKKNFMRVYHDHAYGYPVLKDDEYTSNVPPLTFYTIIFLIANYYCMNVSYT